MFDTSHLHPMIVHFPIALAIVGLFFEIIFFKKGDMRPACGEFILYLACLSIIVAWSTGMLFTASLSGEAHAAKEQHELFATFSAICLVLTSIVYLFIRFGKQKKKILNVSGLALYALSAILISITGFLGGNLVYSYMIGL